jgi:hypothetical protein
MVVAQQCWYNWALEQDYWQLGWPILRPAVVAPAVSREMALRQPGLMYCQQLQPALQLARQMPVAGLLSALWYWLEKTGWLR